MKSRCALPLLAVLSLAHAVSAAAADFSVSGFGTLGYARSDQPYTYQRFIDDRGTFQRDSVAGVQVDARWGSGFGATVQAKAAASSASDSRYDATLAWAFVSYRLNNDWLFRLGKQRIPLYLHSENYDVGATYDFARLPTEMYSITPSNDAIGLSIGTGWKVNDGELALDGYFGQSSNDFRIWLRDSIPTVQRPGAAFVELKFKGGGLVLAYKAQDHTFRLGLHRAVVRPPAGRLLVTGFPFVEVAAGAGYYQVDAALPGPGVPAVSSVTNTTVILGTEVGLPADFRVVAEFARSVVPGSAIAPKGTRGYAALLRRWGRWTPYATYSFLRSPAYQRDFYTAVNDNTLPAFIPGAAEINASQRAGADQIQASHQHSLALGASYSFSATSKLKAEALRTRIREVSRLVDAPPGADVRNANINVLSLSYSVVF